MQELRWIDHLPNGSIDGAIALVNRLSWNITWGQQDSSWYVWGGEKVILKTDSRESAEAFLYGLGLAYSILPEPILDRINLYIGSLIE